MRDIALLVGRIIAGGLVAGHGAQKLLGWFGGPGLQKWTAAMGNRGMRPAALWGPLSAGNEFFGGLLTALGLLSPLGPLGIMSMMATAAVKGHWGKPIWSSKGGAELPLSFLGTAAILVSTGPGRYSLDHLFGIRLPRWLTILAALGVVAGTIEALHPTLTPRLASEPPAEQ